MNNQQWDYFLGYFRLKNLRLCARIAKKYGTYPWVVYRLIHGTGIRNEKEMYIYEQLTKQKSV